jgi:hypothetical protein
MVRANDENTDNPEPDSNTPTKRRNIGHLTRMPDCLMHWWTPLAIAAFFFFSSMFITSIWGTATCEEIMNAIQHFPKRWPFHMRTPSREEIEVCLTITGAGFAFSAWQQRSHDNAVKEDEQAQAKYELERERKAHERNRLEQIERDEYWKRREHILQTLDSNNPGIRLAAISLLAELADSAAHSNLLNPTAQQQLQQHIIHTLCLQFRHEGQLVKSEGTEGEHAEIQNAILQVILDRIQDIAPANNCANWSEQTINLSNSTFLTSVTIKEIQTKATLDLQHSTFTKIVKIHKSKLKALLWSEANFHGSIDVGSTDKETEIGIDSIPNNITEAYFTNCDIITEGKLLIDFSQRNQIGTKFPVLHFKKCTFKSTASKYSRSSDCQHTEIHVSNADKSRHPDQQTTTLTFKECTFHTLYLYFTTISSKVEVLGNTIYNQLNIEFMSPADTKDSGETLFATDARITIRNNKLVKGDQSRPIQITAESRQRISSILQIDNNFAANPNDARDKRVITCSLLDENTLTFHFEEESISTSLFDPWNTGEPTMPPTDNT